MRSTRRRLLSLALVLIASPVLSPFTTNGVADSITVMGATFPSQHRFDTSAVWSGDFAYVFGGCNHFSGSCGGSERLDQIGRYDPATDTVSIMSATLPSRRVATSAIWTGQHAYVFGGRDSNYLDQIVRYDPATDTVSIATAKLPSRRIFTSAIWDGTHAYVFGGTAGTGRLDQIVRFDPATDTTTLLASTLPTPRYATSAIWDGNHAYIFGGHDGAVLDEIVRFDPSTGAVTTMDTRLPAAAYLRSAVWDGTHAFYFARHDKAWRYDTSTDTITNMSSGGSGGRESAVWDGANVYRFGSDRYIIRYNLTPGAPRTLVAEAGPGAGENTLTWNAPPTNTYSALSGYHIYRGAESGSETLHATVGTEASYTDQGLANGATWYYRVSALSPSGESPLSNAASATTFVTPSAPQVPVAVPTAPGDVTIAWLPPADDGGAPVSNYRIYRGLSPAAGEHLADVTSGTTFTDRLCYTGTTCFYAVAAVNAAGEGPPSSEAATAGSRPVDVYKDCEVRILFGTSCTTGSSNPVTTVAASATHTCVLLLTRNVDCWGERSEGQAADHTDGEALLVSTGATHTCVLLASGNVACWGDDAWGKATGYTGGDAIAVAAGGTHTCILLTTGDASCQGSNGYGQSTGYTGGDAVAVTAGQQHTCFLLANGNVTCTGDDTHGQATAYTGGDAVAVSAGHAHTCILLVHGNVTCQGRNDDGQAAGYTGGDAGAVSAGYANTCILREGGDVQCFGSNRYGQANGYSGNDAVALSTGRYHTSVLLDSGRVVAFGRPPAHEDHGQAEAYP